jgi:hypothetical protein
MTKRVVIAIAAVPQEFERRLAMASKLLAASAFDVVLQPWDGSRHALLVADADDAYGRSALDVATRRQDPVLRLSRNAATASVAHDVQIAELTHLLRKLLDAPLEAKPERVNGHQASPALGGLLAAWQEPWRSGTDFALVSGAFTLVVRHKESRVVARSHSDFAAVRARFAREAWSVAYDARHLDAGHADLWQSVDAFLIEGCVASEADLPPLEGSFRLASWPDTGTLHDGEDVMRLAAAMSRASLSVSELALRCRVSKARANAFCWAMRTSGLAAAQASASVAAPLRQAADTGGPISIVARLARRFGLNFGG